MTNKKSNEMRGGKEGVAVRFGDQLGHDVKYRTVLEWLALVI